MVNKYDVLLISKIYKLEIPGTTTISWNWMFSIFLLMIAWIVLLQQGCFFHKICVLQELSYLLVQLLQSIIPKLIHFLLWLEFHQLWIRKFSFSYGTSFLACNAAESNSKWVHGSFLFINGNKCCDTVLNDRPEKYRCNA